MLSSGVVAGFPVVDVKVELIDGKYHDVESTQWSRAPPRRTSFTAFYIAATHGFAPRFA